MNNVKLEHNPRLYDAEHCKRILLGGRYGLMRINAEIVTKLLKHAHDTKMWYGAIQGQLEALIPFSPDVGAHLDNGERLLWQDIHDILCTLRHYDEDVRVWTEFLRQVEYRLDALR